MKWLEQNKGDMRDGQRKGQGSDKSYLIGIGEGMAIKVETQKQNKEKLK